MNTPARLRSLLTLAAAAFLTAGMASCASAPNENGEEDADSFEAVKDIHGGPFTDMMLVYLKTGPNSASQTPEQREEIFKGHMANMKRLADAGILLIAGPFDHPNDPSWRGIFLLDLPSIQVARLPVDTDPGVKAGVFTPEFRPIKASISLRHVKELEAAMLAKNAQGTQPPAPSNDATKPPPNIRGYVMITADDAAAVKAALAKSGLADKVVWCAKFSRKGDKGAVVVVDALKVEDVQAALDNAGVSAGLGLDSWWSTASLTGLEPAAHKLP